jgi:hypothetical protein
MILRIIFCVCFFVSGGLYAQNREFDLYYSQTGKQFLLCEKDRLRFQDSVAVEMYNYYSASIYDSTGKSLRYYSRPQSTSPIVYEYWENYKRTQVELIFSQFLATGGFEKCETRIPRDEVFCEIVVKDSMEGEMLPCGNATHPEPVMKYNYFERVSVNGKLLHEQNYVHSSFTFRFDVKNEQRYLANLTNVWKLEAVGCWAIVTSGGFKVVPI